jgi:hypothetical protein
MMDEQGSDGNETLECYHTTASDEPVSTLDEQTRIVSSL